MRYLIVNADDFGQSEGTNHGIFKCFEQGIVTSASLMVRWPAAREASAYARAHADLSVGLHVDLGEWRSIEGNWHPVYEVARIDDETAVRHETERQLEAFRDLTGVQPTHLDSHQHAHLREPLQGVLRSAAHRLGIPLRHISGNVRYCGDFYGHDEEGRPLPDRITVDGLMKILESLGNGVTELACHPGLVDDLDTMYGIERRYEVETLTDPRIRQAVRQFGIRLVSFGNLSTAVE